MPPWIRWSQNSEAPRGNLGQAGAGRYGGDPFGFAGIGKAEATFLSGVEWSSEACSAGEGFYFSRFPLAQQVSKFERPSLSYSPSVSPEDGWALRGRGEGAPQQTFAVGRRGLPGLGQFEAPSLPER